ncbi:hypothetical protein GCM10007973_29380 [Polymorphobacter multimanifer]|uniref:Methyltransferase type 11 domain-containing protein n=1 Tax=Polymorphobacter multimanifer TaxID=1070431 RepID=A0A841LCE0_9SPHN|nr:methyltransferase domain-containing protein [Polymorphobacter multimanifer]MBB6228653.1 hypothetical protein [Polymorphobacter multimanifer]GGI91200.1 hypothetical protein GCM10007973_29380 [Polymorphobacter multimanifer]
MSEGAWSLYWAQADGQACLPGMPAVLAGRIEGGWTAFAAGLPAGARVLDIATGNGAVLRVMARVRSDLDLTGVDSAQVRDTEGAFRVQGGVPAEALPFAQAHFGAVTAQFGLEYCAAAAWREAARILRGGGVLRLVCHHALSAALVHNRARLAAMVAMDAAGMFGLAREMAAGGADDPVRGAAVLAARQAHAQQSIVMELPAAIGQALGRPDRGVLVAAIERQARGEMARLAAMDAAALDAEALAERLGWLAAAGVTAEAAVIAGPDGAPFAWDIAGSKG